MKKKLLLLCVSLFTLSSCNKESGNYREFFMNAKFTLQNAAFNENYQVNAEPAYFRYIPNRQDCLELFDTKNSYCIYKVSVENKIPKGTAEIVISFKDTSLEQFRTEFTYNGGNTDAYGGPIYSTNCASEIGIQHVRGRYWWVRMDCKLPQLDNKRALLQFEFAEDYGDLPDFNDKIYF